MKEITSHPEILTALKNSIGALADIAGLTLPPLCALELEASFVSYTPGKQLVASFPIPERYANPAGVMQGGFLVAMFDNVFGPLSYLTARRPTTTLDLVTNFLRPARPGEIVRITAEVRGKGRETLSMTGEAFNEKNKLMATASTNLFIFRNIPGGSDK